MRMNKIFTAVISIVLVAGLSSCNSSFLQGMAAGLGGLGSYPSYPSGYAGTGGSTYTGGSFVVDPLPTTSFTYDGSSAGYVAPVYTGSTVGTSTSSSTYSGSSGTSSSGGSCPLCHGSGRIVKDFNVSTFGLDSKEKCSECGQWFMRSTGHRHVTCTQCHGTGRM